MANPTAAMLVIGDEILSGRTRDANMYHLAGRLTEAGIDLREVRVVSDNPEAIICAVQSLAAGFDHVFTSGGIGPTHDDITADCIAEAFGRDIDVREDARRLLADHYARTGKELNAARLRMARIPEGAARIRTWCARLWHSSRRLFPDDARCRSVPCGRRRNLARSCDKTGRAMDNP